MSLLGMSLLYLPDTVYETIFQFCGVFVTTNKLGQCCKYLYNAVKTYAKLSLELSFSPQELQRICDYQVEAIYGLPRERISIQWVLQFIHAPRVYVIGGSEDSRRCDVLDMSCGTWRQCGSLSVKRERAFSAVQHSGQIYAISGSVDHAMVSVEKMNVFKNCWTPVAPLPSAVQCSAVVSYRNRLVVIGGDCRTSYSRIGTIFALKEDESAWEADFLPCLLEGRSEHAACLYRGKIFVAGGFLSSRGFPFVGSSSVESYNEELDTWEECPPLTADRRQFSLVVVAGVMYAVGGDCTGDKDTIEKYDQRNNQWVHVCDFPHKRKASCSTSIGNYILVFGGKREGGKGRLSGHHSTYDVFCTVEWKWLSNNVTLKCQRDSHGLLFPTKQGQLLSLQNILASSADPPTKKPVELTNLDLYRRTMGLTNALTVSYTYPSNYRW